MLSRTEQLRLCHTEFSEFNFMRFTSAPARGDRSAAAEEASRTKKGQAWGQYSMRTVWVQCEYSVSTV
jgi:hypothetical protein